MTVNIPVAPTISIPPVAAPQPAAGGQQDTMQNAATNSQPVQANTSGQDNTTTTNNTQNNTSNSNSGIGNGSTSFSKLLASKASDSTPASGNTSQTSTKTQTPGGDDAEPVDNVASANNNLVNNIIPALLIAELQPASMSANYTEQTVTLSIQQDSGATGNDQGKNLLQQLQLLIQTLLQQAEQLGGNSPSSDSSSASTGDTTSQPQVSAKDPKDQGNSIADLLAQLLALLNQLSQHGQSQCNQPQQVTISFDSLTISSDGQNKSASDILSQLADALSAKLGINNNGNNPADPAPANNNNSGSIINNSTDASLTSRFEVLIDSFIKSAPAAPAAIAAAANNIQDNSTTKNTTDPTIQLQNLFTAISNVLASTQSGSSDTTSSDSNNQDNNKDNSSLNTQVVPLAAQNNQAPATVDFVKLVSANNNTQNNTPVSTPADQVLVQIKNSAATGDNIIRIQLQPADLGKVQVQLVTSSDGNTGVTVTADNRQTLMMLQNEAHSLESALRDIGLKTNAGGLSFNLSGQQQQNTGGFAGNQGGYTQVAAISDTNEDLNYGTTIATYQVGVQQGLDIRV